MILYPHERGNVKIVVDRNFQKKFYCIKCGTDARDLNSQEQFGYYERGTRGRCKTCNTRIEYLY